MMQFGTQRVSADGRLEIGGCDAVDLAREYGTPLYVLDEDHLRANCRAYREALAAVTDRGLVMYASKALTTTAVAALVASEGLGLDVASAGELRTALAASVDPARLLMHGNYKSRTEMEMVLDHGVGRVVVDSLEEIAAWEERCAAAGRRQRILIRANPNVKPKTHTSIQVGQLDSKFGLSILSGAALAAVQKALACPHLELVGVHSHIGSQVLGWQAFAEAARQVADFLAEVKAQTGAVLDEVDLGGGLGIRYLPEHQPPAVAEFVREVVGALLARLAEHGLPKPLVLLEPGRSIVGEAGTTLYTLGVIKEIPGVRTYVSVDGGLSDNPRPEMYEAEYHVFIAGRADARADTVVTVSGKHCETDTLFRDVALAAPRVGDILAVQSTGAYNYAMASHGAGA